MSTPPDPADAPAAEARGVVVAAPARKSERPNRAQSLVGMVLSGRYLIERLIGEGGMGAVYQAEHTHMRKRLAVKVLHSEMSRLPEVVARFEREAMAAAHIEHPNVAAATDFGKLDDGSFFLVLEYVEGRSLRDAISEGPLELGRAFYIARQMASALSRAHALGIVHRDLKPENIMLVTRDGEADFVKVLDFGIAKVPVGELGSRAEAPGQVLTQVGMVYGTPEYMAPEQALGQTVDPRADLYGLGVILFEMLTGTRPFEHESKVTLLGMHVTAPIPTASERAPEANLPAAADALVTRLLAKDAADRFTDAKALIETIDAATHELAAQGRIPDASPGALLARPRPSTPRLNSPETAAVPAQSLHESAFGDAGGKVLLARRKMGSWVASSTLRTRVAAASGAAVILLAFAISLTRGKPAEGPPTAPVAGASTTAMPSESPKRDSMTVEAKTNIDKGDYATAIDELHLIATTYPDRADVHMLLERAYSGVRNVHDALREAGVWLLLDPNGAADLKLQEDVRNAALVKETQEDAIALLESKMGSRGVDILFEIAYGTSGRLYPQASLRAKRSLALDDVRARASTALALVLQFRDAKTCDAKHALLGAARDQGDARLLPTLQQLQTTRGCGFLGASDCHPCMRRDSLLTDATNAIVARDATQ